MFLIIDYYTCFEYRKKAGGKVCGGFKATTIPLM